MLLPKLTVMNRLHSPTALKICVWLGFLVLFFGVSCGSGPSWKKRVLFLRDVCVNAGDMELSMHRQRIILRVPCMIPIFLNRLVFVSIGPRVIPPC